MESATLLAIGVVAVRLLQLPAAAAGNEGFAREGSRSSLLAPIHCALLLYVRGLVYSFAVFAKRSRHQSQYHHHAVIDPNLALHPF
jgi:hypothetical protein